MNKKEIGYITIIFLLLLVFTVSLFKNISYPLLWGDESETAVFAQRILRYGYPKVDDGRNVLNLTMIPDKSVGVKESIDAWIHLPWIQYYFAAIPVFIAQNYRDIYFKTGIIRFPFALAGYLGVIIFGISLFLLNLKREEKLKGISIYLLLTISSIPLVLHLREVRSYSLTLLISSLLFLLVNKLIIKTDENRKNYFFVIVYAILQLLLLNNYPPAFVIWNFSLLVISVVFLWFDYNNKIKKTLITALFVSIITSIPFIIFYETIPISMANAAHFNNSMSAIFEKTVRALLFLSNKNNLIMALLGIGLAVLLKRKSKLKDLFIKSAFVRTIFFGLVFFVSYVGITVNQPYLFDRYLITLIPVLSVIFTTSYLYISKDVVGKNANIIISVLFLVVYLILLVVNLPLISGHVYELTHRYQGPLDGIINYIIDKYPDNTDLVIETNREKTSYIFYLNGNVMRELKDDVPVLVEPDILIFGNFDYLYGYNKVAEEVLNMAEYKKVIFRIQDYPVNNIPELSIPLKHLFKTQYTEEEEDSTVIYINKKIYRD